MNQIIVFPGEMNGVFFKNEISYINDVFDKVIVLTYPGDKTEYQIIAERYNVDYYIVPVFSFYSFLISMKQMLFDKIVRSEKKNRTFKQLLYMFLYLCWANSAEKIFKDKCVDDNIDTVLYSFWLSRGAYAACRIANKYKVRKTVSRAHRYDLYEERNSSQYLPFRTFIADTLDEIHFISEDGLNYFNGKYKDYNSKLCLSRLGTKRNSYKKLICEKDKVCIASCSSIIAVKRIDLIIDVLSKLHIPFLWIHLGDGELRGEMEKYACSKLRSGAYEFLGYVDNEEISSIYEKYDVDFFLNLSDSEGVPVSIMEAMSMGIPAIARNVGGNREIIDGENGLLLKDTMYEQQIEQIVSKRFQKEEYEKLVDASYDIWEQNYCDEENYKRFFDALAKI